MGKETLMQLGMSSEEAELYLSLLSLGGTKLAALSRATGINRPKLYKLLPKMVAKGLISESVKGKQTLYVPTHPDRLKQLMSETQKNLDELLPDLTRQYEGHTDRPVVRYVYGRDGLKKVFRDMVQTLRPRETIYRYSSPPRRDKGDYYLPQDYREIRDAKKLERLVISGAWYAEGKRPRLERDIKILSEIDEKDFKVTTLIYGNSVAIIDYQAESCVIIESEGIARFQKALFLQLYKRL